MSIRAKPMLLLCKFIGVAPYSFDPESSQAKFKTSRFGIVYSLFVGALLSWFAVFNHETTHSNLVSGSYVTIGAQWLQFYINNGFSVLIIIANSLQQWKVVEVFNVLFDARDHPKKLLDHVERGRDIFYGTTIVVITIFFHLLTTLTSLFDNEKRIGYYWYPYGILLLINTLVVLQYLSGVVKIGQKFKAMNVQLEDLIGKQQIATSSYNNLDINDLTIKSIAENHLKLINQTNLLISAFSYQLLLCFVAALIISVSGLYLICKRIIQRTLNAQAQLSDPELQEKHYNWWCLSCYPLLHIILLSAIITVCQWTVNQSNLLTETLPRIERVVRLSQSSSAIDSFCHQILLQRISFNVFDIFTICPSMVCSIISTVLTYLIVLVQFEVGQDTERTQQMDAFNSWADPPFGQNNGTEQ